jgi:hypothetical protein
MPPRAIKREGFALSAIALTIAVEACSAMPSFRAHPTAVQPLSTQQQTQSNLRRLVTEGYPFVRRICLQTSPSLREFVPPDPAA